MNKHIIILYIISIVFIILYAIIISHCNWRDIGEELAEEYQGNDWVMDNCRLYEYET